MVIQIARMLRAVTAISLRPSTIARRKSTAETLQMTPVADVEELERMRDKSRLPERVKLSRAGVPFAPGCPNWHYEKHHLRKLYARMGARCGLNPGIAWPTREELESIKQFDRETQPPLEELMRRVEEKRQNEILERKQREEEVERGLAMLEEAKVKLIASKRRKEEEARAELAKKEQVIDEVREILGYNVQPHDPKFQEVLQQKQEDQKKARKAARKKDRQEKMLLRLTEMASESAKGTSVQGASTSTADEANEQKNI